MSVIADRPGRLIEASEFAFLNLDNKTQGDRLVTCNRGH